MLLGTTAQEEAPAWKVFKALKEHQASPDLEENRATTEIAEFLVSPVQMASLAFPGRKEQLETALTVQRDNEAPQATTERLDTRAFRVKEGTLAHHSRPRSYSEQPGPLARLVNLAETDKRGLLDPLEHLDSTVVPDFKERRESTELTATRSKDQWD